MKLEVIGKGLTVTSAMWEQAETKLAKIADLFADTDSLNAVVVYKVHPRTGEQSVEVTLTSRQLTVRAKSRGTDTYECLDLCIDKLTGQLRKAKTQQERSRSRGFLDDFADFDTQNEQPVDVTKVKKLDLVPMDVDEAIARMDALGHSFFVYLDSTTNLVNVLYVRDEGGYGRIELERA